MCRWCHKCAGSGSLWLPPAQRLARPRLHTVSLPEVEHFFLSSPSATSNKKKNLMTSLHQQVRMRSDDIDRASNTLPTQNAVQKIRPDNRPCSQSNIKRSTLPTSFVQPLYWEYGVVRTYVCTWLQKKSML